MQKLVLPPWRRLRAAMLGAACTVSTLVIATRATAADATLDTGATTIIRSNVPGPAMRTQRFFLTYDAVFDVKEMVRGEVSVWLPFPVQDNVQSVENYWMGGTLPPEKLLSFAVKRESEYGNRYIEARVQDPEPGDKLSFQYSIVRREYSNPPVGAPLTGALIMPPARRLLLPDNMVPLDGPVAKLATEALAGINPKTADGRDAAIKALYNKTISMLAFDKSGEGWGRGDVDWIIKNKRGDCVDFHSLLVGMARASGIPAKFEIGVSIPNDKAKGVLSDAHCWAYLYHPQRGWIPLDASEGWKNEHKFAEYYQGRIGSDRVAFSTGRDLKLGQRGAPLNYFFGPYAEMADKKSAEIDTVPVKASLSFEKLTFP